MAEWNPRYVAWATANGRTPEEQQKHEHGEQGGNLREFSSWLLARWEEWRELRGLKRRGIDRDYLTPEQHADFDAWVQSRAAELAGAIQGEATA